MGTGAPRFLSRSITGGGVSTRAARHMQGFGSSGVPGGEGKRAAFTVLTSIRAKRRQAHERKEADVNESEKRRTMRGARGDLSPHDEGTGASLMVDAYQRVSETGAKVRYTKSYRKLVYGY